VSLYSGAPTMAEVRADLESALESALKDTLEGALDDVLDGTSGVLESVDDSKGHESEVDEAGDNSEKGEEANTVVHVKGQVFVG
jgi:hypothetical protein